jgi:heme/copper-type cytochrome/quinol oxidase subunit 3
MAATTHDPALAPPPQLPRPRTLLVGTAFATGAVLLFFAGLFATYVQERAETIADGGTWIAPGTISLIPGGMMMLTMAMSVVIMQWAVYAIARDDRPHAYLALGLVGLFGVSVITQTVYLYNQMGFVIDESKVALFVYVVTGAHLAMLVAAMVFAGLMGFRALAGQFTGRHADGLAAAALFWHATVAVYAAVWYVVYITK